VRESFAAQELRVFIYCARDRISEFSGTPERQCPDTDISQAALLPTFEKFAAI
jgi:hypothetical protein